MPSQTTFFAHSTERADQSDWQTLAEHLIGTGNAAAENASAFGREDVAYIAGLLHDLGKYTREFQLRLKGEFSKLDHATWGAKIAREWYGWQLSRNTAHFLSFRTARL